MRSCKPPGKCRKKRSRKNQAFSPVPFLVLTAATSSITMATPKGIDVVGVDNGSHGRHCENHAICGHFVKVDDYLFCKWAVQKFDLDAPESCVQVFKLAADGHIGCHVGYLPRRLIKASRDKSDARKKDGGKSFDGLWLKVICDLRISDNSSERSRSHRNFGIVYCHVVEEDWLLGKDPFEVTIQIPKKVIEKSFELPAAPTPETTNIADDEYDTDKEED
jgi:hypothetical protein